MLPFFCVPGPSLTLSRKDLQENRAGSKGKIIKASIRIKMGTELTSFSDPLAFFQVRRLRFFGHKGTPLLSELAE